MPLNDIRVVTSLINGQTSGRQIIASSLLISQRASAITSSSSPRELESNFSRRQTTLVTSSNQRLWECVRRRIKVYTDPLHDFPSWHSTSKNQPFFINNRVFTERYFSGKVHAILIEEVPVQTALRDGPSFRRLTSLIGLKYLHQPSNFVLNILTLTCNV